MLARILPTAVIAMLLSACAPVNTKTPLRPELTPAQINVQLSLRHWRNHQPRLALDKINVALEQSPRLGAAHNLAGMIYDRLGQAERANWHFQRAVALDPNDPSAHNNYGLFLCEQGRLAQAERHLLAAADNPSNPAPEVAYTNAGLCARRIPDPDRAAQYFTAALNANPMMPAALFQTARISFEKGRYPEARRDLQHYLQVSPHTAETLWLAVQIARAMGNREQEVQYARELEASFPQSEEAQALFESEAQAGFTRITPSQSVTSASSQIRITSAADTAFKGEDWVRDQDSQDYTVQLFASQNEDAMAYFRDEYELSGNLAYVALPRGRGVWYTLIWGDFDSRRQANNAISQLPEALRGGASQVRSFGELQLELTARRGN